MLAVVAPTSSLQRLDTMSDSDMNVLSQSCASNKRKVDKDDDHINDDDGNDGFVTPSPTKRIAEPGSKESIASNGFSSHNESPVKGKKTKKTELSPEQQVKEAEKEEKKRVREVKRAEKAAKDAAKEAKFKKEAAAKAKAASFMSSFVQQRPRSASPVKVERKEVPTLSDFERVFQACTYKDLAPVNRFAGRSESSSGSSLSAGQIENKEDLLDDFKNTCHAKRGRSRSRRGVNPPISVRESMRLITEASVLGDEKLEENGKRGLANLSDRRKVPMKLLHFASDRRPAWYGEYNFVGESMKCFADCDLQAPGRGAAI
jgi:chromatin assembly factor 1 subunit A